MNECLIEEVKLEMKALTREANLQRRKEYYLSNKYFNIGRIFVVTDTDISFKGSGNRSRDTIKSWSYRMS